MHIIMKTYGIIPKNPFEEDDKIEVIIWVLSFNAVGLNMLKTPILHIKNNKIYGTRRHNIEGTLKKYLRSNFGTHA